MPTTAVDDSYEIDVDGPSYDEPAVAPTPGVAADLPVKARREAKAKRLKEPKAPKRPKEPKQAKEPRPAKPAKVPRPPKMRKPPKVRTGNANRFWAIAAGVAGAIGLVSSMILATGALFFALDAGQGSTLFTHLSDVCDGLVGPLKDVFSFSGINANKKEALVAWGTGSMAYLLVGRFVQSIFMSRIKD